MAAAFRPPGRLFASARSIATSPRCSAEKAGGLTEEMRANVRRFVRQEIIPTIHEFDAKAEFPWPLAKKLHKLGLTNVDTPRGQGLSLKAKVGLFEELAYGDAGLATALMISDLAQVPLLHAGSPELKKKYVGRLCAGPRLAAYATTESEAGSDLARAKLKATQQSNGDWILDGEKAWITNAGVADWAFVLAATDSNESTGHRFTGFVVDRKAEGVNVGENERKLGLRTADTRGLVLERVRVPKENVVGEVGGGFPLAMRAFNRVRPVIAALACGYALERKTFDRPIIEHEGVSFKLADMAQRLEASRLLALEAAEKVEADSADAAYFSAIAKCFAADAAVSAATNALQVFGANGSSPLYPVEKLLRDSTSFKIIGGTSEIQRLIIARQLKRRIG
ncbi:putative medium-chain specific acyl-CoA dehydrogenase 10, mitochondrial [Aphelenchoides fujianensis]|nr:putative medium-chain specific acyl-CoA dehydrogenase 10, mitochondrial [Aphelenchoides fujianensis]